MAEPRTPIDLDLSDPGIYAERVPDEEFALMRKTAPVCWVPQEPGTTGFDDGGYWAVTRYHDVVEVSRNSDVYSTWENTALIRFAPDMPRERIDMQRYVLLNIDPPQHTKLRQIVSRGFTPRAINNLRDALADKAQRIVHKAVSEGSGEFVTEVACELPLMAIAELLGVPQEDRHKIFDWSNQMIGYDDPEYDVDPLAAGMELLSYSMSMAEERKACPMDDIVTKLVTAEIDGEHLSADEFGFFVIILAVAGNETTRNSISHGMLGFMEHPEQWELYKETRARTAPDEIVRWATPVTVFQRTAKVDTTLGGQEIKAGQRVGLFYRSANFDEEVFDQPRHFDITRSPNPHLGFGGSGAHFCLGANLARLQIDLIFNAIADHMPNIRKLSEPRRLRSGWLNGIKELRVAYN